MTACTAAATSPPWRGSTRCTSPSLACPSLAAPTLSLSAKVGRSQLPPGGGAVDWASLGRGQLGGAALPPLAWASVLPLSGLSLVPCSGPSSSSLALLRLSSPRSHLRESPLQLFRTLLLSALPTGATVLGSVFLWEGTGWAGGPQLAWSGWEEAWPTDTGVTVLHCPGGTTFRGMP